MKTYVIGDVHGCYYTLLNLINKLPLERSDKLLFLGDYIDRGNFSKQVVEYVKTLTESGQGIALMGNHEAMCLNKNDYRMWIYNGGDATLDSYDKRNDDQKSIPKSLDERKVWLKDRPKVSEEHLNWMRNLPLFYEDEKHYYVHAGIDPEYSLNRQTEYDLLWIRNRFLNSKRLFDKKIVFGHTPLKDVLFQHNKIGVDTGCVYGNKLSCICMETNEIFTESLNERDENEYSRKS